MPSNEQRRANAKRKLERQIARRAERAKRRRIVAVAGTVLGVVVVVGAVYLFAFPGEEPTAAGQEKPPPPRPGTVNCDYQRSPEPAAKPAQAPQGRNVPASGEVNERMRTSIGELELTLDRKQAPCTVNSFVSLSKQGYFDDTSCHRMTTNAPLRVLQCGDPTGSGSGGPGYSFADEVAQDASYERGTLAMANSGPNTNGSQFFIVYGDSQLPPNYTVFGSIDEPSLKRVDKVAEQGVTPGKDPNTGEPTRGDGKPKQEVRIQKTTIVA